ncbi:MAG: malonyl-CoA decarboxylase [Geothermobacteraceae bacterium]
MFRSSLKTIGRGLTGLTSLLGGRGRKNRIDLANGDIDLLKRQLDQWVKAHGGEVSARDHARQIGELYLMLSDTGRRRFLQLLARDFGIDREAMKEQCRAYLQEDADHGRIEQTIHELLEPPRLKLLSQFNTLPNGIKFLVDLRRDLLALSDQEPELADFDRELRHLLATWFDVGFLQLQQIDWNSPASLLEKLVAYEAVHEIHSWQDLRHRLHLDRRCYAFFHPNMPGEPLIFVEVALTRGMADSIQTLLDESTPDVAPQEADTAIFYSISNAQQGLRGISFGNFLIKRVVEKLKVELPNIKTFATLSPIPGFARWVSRLDKEHLQELAGTERLDRVVRKTGGDPDNPIAYLLEVPAWHRDAALADVVRPALEKLLFHYFHTRRSDNQPIDPVQRFHLGNGARLERVNWLGDTSPKGMKQSFGLMVNYLYRLQDIDKNHEAYATNRRIAISSAVKALGK